MWLKEIRVCGKCVACPDVPAASVAFRPMAKAVERPLARPRVTGDPYLRVGRRFHEIGSVLPTDPTLEQVVAFSHFRVGRAVGRSGASRASEASGPSKRESGEPAATPCSAAAT
jgi:hypothetical protein